MARTIRHASPRQQSPATVRSGGSRSPRAAHRARAPRAGGVLVEGAWFWLVWLGLDYVFSTN
jgi:hypothetical protein